MATRGTIRVFDAETGKVDLNWQPPRFSGGSNGVKDIVVSGKRVYVLGGFGSVNGQLRPWLAALDAETGEVADWRPPRFEQVTGSLTAIAASGPRVYVSGWFARVGGEERERFVALDAETGAVDTGWRADADRAAWRLAVNGDRLYAGGFFSRIGGQDRDRLAALDIETGAVDESWRPNANNSVWALSAADDSIYVGGEFTRVGGGERSFLAELDTKTGAATSWNPNARYPFWGGGEVYSISFSGKGSSRRVFAGGLFHTFNEVVQPNFAAFSSARGAGAGHEPTGPSAGTPDPADASPGADRVPPEALPSPAAAAESRAWCLLGSAPCPWW